MIKQKITKFNGKRRAIYQTWIEGVKYGVLVEWDGKKYTPSSVWKQSNNKNHSAFPYTLTHGLKTKIKYLSQRPPIVASMWV